jgi:NADPH-dependent 2,4-dienoyl-CoA reductase/sulfur reductase-like enzyme
MEAETLHAPVGNVFGQVRRTSSKRQLLLMPLPCRLTVSPSVGSVMSATYDIVIAGGGIAGGALAAVLARGGVAVAVLERDPVPIDRVSGGRIRRRILSQLRWPPTPI